MTVVVVVVIAYSITTSGVLEEELDAARLVTAADDVPRLSLLLVIGAGEIEELHAPGSRGAGAGAGGHGGGGGEGDGGAGAGVAPAGKEWEVVEVGR